MPGAAVGWPVAFCSEHWYVYRPSCGVSFALACVSEWSGDIGEFVASGARTKSSSRPPRRAPPAAAPARGRALDAARVRAPLATLSCWLLATPC